MAAAAETARRSLTAPLRRSLRSSGGSAKTSDSSVSRSSRGRESDQVVQYALDEIVRHRGSAGHPHRVNASQPCGINLGRVIDPMAALAPASSATSTRRTELDEFAEPTTITRSLWAAICLMASCRFWVA